VRLKSSKAFQLFETGKQLIIGQSGSGKTVLLKVFWNPYPESGKICFDGEYILN
jgi:ABC-type bacteriocin/lantibiotic exporter with double-glycine peptidase domain